MTFTEFVLASSFKIISLLFRLQNVNYFFVFVFQEVINFLLTTEIIPLCLRIMESGSELSKTVATFILQKILLDDTG